MMETTHQARAALEAAGLVVSESNSSSLLIGVSLEDASEGLRIVQDACALNQRNGEWITLLPAEGLLHYEIPGTLAESVALFVAAYQDYRKNGGMFKDVSKRLVKNADQYLIGRSLAGIR
jgi:hypothetical protein